jgi:TolB protein
MSWTRIAARGGLCACAAVAAALLLGVTRAPEGGARPIGHAADPVGTVAFVRATEERSEIWLTAADGLGARRITRSVRALDESPAWAPDGRALALARTLDGGRSYGIYVVRTGTAGVPRLISPREGRFAQTPSWSPDGRLVAFTGSGGRFGNCKGDVFVVRPDGTGFRRLLRGRPIALNPVWSPDGTKLAVVRVDGQEHQSIWIGTAAGTRLHRLVAGSAPAWSPDGRRLAFTRAAGGITRVFVVGSSGRGLRRLTTSEDFELDPAWSPDGRWIAYWSTAGGRQAVFATSVGGGPRRAITRPRAGRGDSEPAWRPLTTH